MIAAWQAAARDLGLITVAPFDLDGTCFPILIKQFGRPKGALPLLTGDFHRFGIAKQANYFPSLLNPEHYLKYERNLFKDTLNDWQWFGEDPPPKWYTGEKWG